MPTVQNIFQDHGHDIIVVIQHYRQGAVVFQTGIDFITHLVESCSFQTYHRRNIDSRHGPNLRNNNGNNNDNNNNIFCFCSNWDLWTFI